jgi:hypothetical protein
LSLAAALDRGEIGAQLTHHHGHWHLEPRPPPAASPRTQATGTGAAPTIPAAGKARGTDPPRRAA